MDAHPHEEDVKHLIKVHHFNIAIILRSLFQLDAFCLNNPIKNLSDVVRYRFLFLLRMASCFVIFVSWILIDIIIMHQTWSDLE